MKISKGVSIFFQTLCIFWRSEFLKYLPELEKLNSKLIVSVNVAKQATWPKGRHKMFFILMWS